MKGKSLKADCEKSEITQNIAVLLETLRDKIREFPPIDQPSRFGNAAFKQWFAHITTVSI